MIVEERSNRGVSSRAEISLCVVSGLHHIHVRVVAPVRRTSSSSIEMQSWYPALDFAQSGCTSDIICSVRLPILFSQVHVS